MEDWLDSLERLHKLKEAGALTDVEYEAEKHRIMGEMGGASTPNDIPEHKNEQSTQAKPEFQEPTPLEPEPLETPHHFVKDPKAGEELVKMLATAVIAALVVLVLGFFYLKSTMIDGDITVKEKDKENTVTESNAQSDIQVVKGECESQSHIAEGNIGENLTKRRSRFYCDSAVISFFDPKKEHIMVQFAESKSHNNNQLGFSGLMEADGQIMDVKTVYLGERRVRVSEGNCKFFFKNKELNGIACGAPVDEEGRRTVPVVNFAASPGQ